MEASSSMISSLVQTKSIERVLAPIATQVSMLIIHNEAFIRGDKCETPRQFVACAESVMHASEGLVRAAQKTAMQSQDMELKREMPEACELINIAGQHMVMAAQKVHSKPDCIEGRRSLVRAAKEILEGTMRVMLVSDKAEIRKILQAAQWVIDRTTLLGSVKSMKALVPCFKGFTESLMLLSNLVDKRQKELANPRQRERLIATMSLLKKAVPMLSSAMQNFVKYNNNSQARASKEYVTSQILASATDLMAIVENKFVEEDFDEPEEMGHFVATVDKILEQLQAEERHNITPEFAVNLQAIIKHSMAVAHLSDDRERTAIIKACQTILHQKGVVIEQSKHVQANADFAELRSDFENHCDQLIEDFQELERHVNAAVLHQVVDVFKETIEPLERLVKAALSPLKDKTPMKERACLELLEPHIDTFNLHSDKMCQVASFTAASSTNSRRARVIRSCVKRLEKLDPEILPATIACRKDYLDKGAVEYLRLLKREWTNEVETLVNNIDDIIDPSMFIEVSVQHTKCNSARCRVVEDDISEIEVMVQSNVGQGRRVEQVVRRLIDHNDDPVYRNGLLVYVKELRKAISAVKSCGHDLIKGTAPSNGFQVLCDQNEALVKALEDMLSGLDESSHPEILSPLRHGVRSFQPGQKPDLDGADYAAQRLVLDTGVRHPSNVKESDQFLSLGLPGTVDETKQSFEQLKSSTIIRSASIIGSPLNSQISRLVKELIKAAIAGEKTRVNLLCNDVLQLGNSVVDNGNNVARCTNNKDLKQSLEYMISAVSELTTKLIDKAKKVCDKDIGELDPLHDVSDQWVSKMSSIKSTIGDCTKRYHAVAKKVGDAAKMKNLTLLKPEVLHIQQHQGFLADLVAKVTNVDDTLVTDITVREKLRNLKGLSNDVANLTTMLVTMADLMICTDKEHEQDQMDMTCEEWGIQVYCLVMAIDTLHATLITQHALQHEMNTGATEEANRENKCKVLIKETARWADLVTCATTGCQDEYKKEQANSLVCDLNHILAVMSEDVQTLPNTPPSLTTPGKFYADSKIKVLLCQWTYKVSNLKVVLDNLTSHVAVPVEQLARSAILAHCASGSSKAAQVDDFSVVVKNFKTIVSHVSNKSLKAISSAELEHKSLVRQTLDDINKVTPKLADTAKLLIDLPSDANMQTFSQYRRLWSCKMAMLLGTLQGMNRVDKGLVQEIINLVQHSDMMTSPDVSQTSMDTSLLMTSLMGYPCTPVTPARGRHLNLTNDGSFLSTKTPPPTLPKPVLKPGNQQEVGQKVEQRQSPDVGNVRKGSPAPRPLSRLSQSSPSPRPSSSGAKPKTVEVWQVPPRTPQKWSSKSVQQIAAAAWHLQQETDKWEDDQNAIVKICKEMSAQMYKLSEFAKKQGQVEQPVNKEDLILTSKAIAKNGEAIVKFARIIAEYCVDKRFAEDLSAYTEHIPTISTQLNIISSVKAATPEDRTAEKVLVKNAENLMQAVMKTLKAAEAACVKGLRQPPKDAEDETQAIVLATQWKRKLTKHRQMEASAASMDELGLRRINPNTSGPALNEIFIQR